MMFEPIELASGLPYRRRSAALAETRYYDEFTCRDFTLFVLRRARELIEGYVGKAAPNETMGLLSGRSFFDEEGEYTIVGGATVAPRLTAHGSRVHVDPHQMSELREDAARRHPYLDVVGWFHSHSYDSPYSEVDRSEQKQWEQRHNVGILAFMQGQGAIWARAYQGPDSTLLERVPPRTDRALGPAGAARPAGTAGTAGTAGVTPPALAAAAPGFTAAAATPATPVEADKIYDLTPPEADPDEGPPSPPQRSMRLLMAVIVALLVAAAVTSLAVLGSQLGDGDDDPTSARPNPAPTTPSVGPTDWSCEPAEEPGMQACVLASDVTARPLWTLDGEDHPGGVMVVFEDLEPGRHVVGLELVSGTEVVDAGTHVIDVADPAGEDEPAIEDEPDGERQPGGAGGGHEGS
jgi:proteasome lid subunit RPN8/RPN11